MTKTDILNQLARIHDLRCLRARRVAAAASDRVRVAETAMYKADAMLAACEKDARGYTAEELAAFKHHGNVECLFSALALRRLASARALSKANAAVSASSITLQKAEHEQGQAAQVRLSTEARADRIGSMAQKASRHRDRQIETRAEAATLDALNGRAAS